jgi:hypothetical protein
VIHLAGEFSTGAAPGKSASLYRILPALDDLPDDVATLKAMLLAERAQSERLRHLLAQLRRAQFGRSYCANAGSIPPAGVLTSSPRTDGPCSFQGAAHARGELGWTLLVQGFLTFGVDA